MCESTFENCTIHRPDPAGTMNVNFLFGHQYRVDHVNYAI